MRLYEILHNTGVSLAFPDTEISDICYDSRKAAKGTVFVCLKGHEADGHKYAADAYNKGCRVFCAQDDISLPSDAIIIKHSNTRQLLALISANFFSHPASKLLTIALTGTKGKTSTAYMISSILQKAGKKVGIIGTIGIATGDKLYKCDNSTPESYLIHKYLREMVDSGIDVAVMETSSQGFKHDRTFGMVFDVGVFTNLSPDHIGDGEHKDYEEYRKCKRMLFSACKAGFFNADDGESGYMKNNAKCKVFDFGLKNSFDYYASDIVYAKDAGKLVSAFDLCHGGKKISLSVPYPGIAGVYNSVCAGAVCSYLGVSDDIIKEGLESISVKGRNEIINSPLGFSIIIDYAHNELSVKTLYETISPYRNGKVWTVFGCGGNRSKLRRYTMGDIVTKNSDVAVVTSDNPRFEKLDDIISDIMQGITSPMGEVKVIKDRKEAIEYCLKNAKRDDIILIIGKGHQGYEEIEGVKYPFDERKIVTDFLGL